jgi:hypothetical protein
VATRKPSKEDASDFNTDVAVAIRKATGNKHVRGEDLLSDPRLKKEFREIKKRAAAKQT